jgi:uncharacterized membrane protein
MTLAPLLNAPLAVQVHALGAATAFVLGIVQFASPKGTRPHRMLGWVWSGLMLGVAESVALNFVDTQWAEAVSFLVLFAFIIFRPSGIFGIAQAR